MTDRMSKRERRKVMRSIKSKNTKPEKQYMKLHKGAIPHPDWLPYHPDFLWKQVVVFIDSLFWHCWISASRYASLSKFWQNKLFNNFIRDVCSGTFYSQCGPEVDYVRVRV